MSESIIVKRGWATEAKSAVTGKRIIPRLYSVWRDMRNRCNNPRNPRYHRYGGRGISVCAEWSDYSNFRAWAISNGFSKDLTIDRIDNDGNYEPSNCQWITRAEHNSKDATGEKNGRAKLTEADVRAIRKSSESQRVLARRYGVCKTNISNIKTGKKWGHVQ